MNLAYDNLIVHQANSEVLQPDHSFLVRLIIPGYIRGRMIKWLAAIKVINHETKNHYEYHDNRILPPHITAEESLREEWRYKPEYIYNELNINSAVSQPDHKETLSIAKNISSNNELAGYAYTGGGRKVSRVEITTNGGVNCQLCDLERKERPTDYGIHWCWLWWSLKIPVADLVGCKEISCRAWDESSNAQPNNPTWNLMGMGTIRSFMLVSHGPRRQRRTRVPI